jgi:RNA recognition motif-containing protein
MNIYVGNLSHDVTEENLRQAFGAFGQVTSVRIVKDRYSGQPRGFGFIEMPNRDEAQAAIKNLNGQELMGRKMNVSEARARRDQGRSGQQRAAMGPTGRINRY